MKFTPISKAFFGVPEEDESFDLDAATRVFKWYMADDTAEQVMVHTLAAEVPRLIEYHNEEISKAVERQYKERKEILKRAVIDGAISKSMSDEAIDEISKAVELIEKANEYNMWERQENARKQWRNKSGQFRTMGRLNIEPPSKGEDPIKDEKFNARTPAHHHPAPVAKLPKDQALKYQNAYAQISAALDADNFDDVRATQQIKNGSGKDVARTAWGTRPEDFIHPDDFKGRANVVGMEFQSANAAPYDAMRALGASRGVSGQASYQVTDGGLNTGKVQEFNNNWQTASAWDESGATRGFKRLGAASTFADQIFGNVDDPRVKAAIAAGKWAGQYGPEAEKVIGPHARKSAYRYRGVERKADARLNNAYRSAIATATTPTDARTRIIYPRVTQQVAGRGQGVRTVTVPVESPVINYMRSILPQEDLLHLHTNSGAIAPSQGVIIDSKGAIATQAVGYGDDHYLPFNLKNLKALKGGEYIRTRTLGGPTTEDVYTGMASGARAFTVVSHSGVYTVEFADDFRGGRRFNDKSARMVKRYGMLLDSLAAEQVTLTPVPKSRQDELMRKATGRFPGDDESSRQKRIDYFDRLKKEEQQDPKPSAAEKEEWATEFLDQQAAEFDDGTGQEKDWKQLRGKMLARAAASSGDDPDYLASQFATSSGAIVAMGLGEEYAAHVKDKERQYVAAQKPLRLNADGYYYALQALQEQFPYYIANVEYRPWEKTSNQKDAGYVKPRFNRPANIKSGYWDESIEGHKGLEVTDARTGKKKTTGKVSADQTNYQNWTARENLRSATRDSEKDKPAEGDKTPGGGTGSGTTSTPGGALSPLEKAENRYKLAKMIQSNDLSVKDKGGSPVKANEKDRKGMAATYPIFMTRSPEDIRRLYSDPENDTFRKQVDAEITAIKRDDRILIDKDYWDDFDSTGVNQEKSFSVETATRDKKAWLKFGDDADATLDGNSEITQANLEQFVENNDDIYNASEAVKLNGLGDTSGLSKIDKGLEGYVSMLTELEVHNRKGEFGRGVGFLVGSQDLPTYEEAKEALDTKIKNLSKLRQAKRRFDELGKGINTSGSTRVIGFTDPDGGLQPGPNGTKPLGPNGTVPITNNVSLKPITDVFGPTMQKATDEELDAFNAMSQSEQKKYLESIGKRMSKGYYSLRRL